MPKSTQKHIKSTHMKLLIKLYRYFFPIHDWESYPYVTHNGNYVRLTCKYDGCFKRKLKKVK